MISNRLSRIGLQPVRDFCFAAEVSVGLRLIQPQSLVSRGQRPPLDFKIWLLVDRKQRDRRFPAAHIREISEIRRRLQIVRKLSPRAMKPHSRNVLELGEFLRLPPTNNLAAGWRLQQPE